MTWCSFFELLRVDMGKIISGTYWIMWANAHAKNSTSVDDLVEPFKSNAKAFIKALEGAGAKVDISTTRRMMSGDEWKYRNGLADLRERGIHLPYSAGGTSPIGAVLLTVPRLVEHFETKTTFR